MDLVDKTPEELEEDRLKEERETANSAFDAGYDGADFETEPEEDKDEGLVGDEIDTTTVEDNETEVDDPQKESDDTTEESDEDKAARLEQEAKEAEDKEWAGVPDTLRSRFEKMQADLDAANNIAKTADGRARQLQSKIDRSTAPKKERVPSPDLLREAMTSAEKMNELRVDWPEHAAAMEEQIVVVGKQFDLQRDEFSAQLLQEKQSTDKKLLDINHKGWENITVTQEFRDWVFENGPRPDQQAAYQGLLENKKFAEADAYYQALLDENPEWADTRGILYGSPDVVDSIELLSLYKNKDIKEVDEAANLEAEARRQRLEENITPTDGGSGRSPSYTSKTVDEAFDDGFNGH